MQALSVGEIKKLLTEMKNGKSQGPGRLSVGLLEIFWISYYRDTEEMFNRCLVDQEDPPRE